MVLWVSFNFLRYLKNLNMVKKSREIEELIEEKHTWNQG